MRLQRTRLQIAIAVVAYALLFLVTFKVTTAFLTRKKTQYIKIEDLGVGMYEWQTPVVPCNCFPRHGKQEIPENQKATHYTSLADRAVNYGIDTVYLKVADGIKPFRYFDDRLVEAYLRRHIQVAIWSYNYCNNPRLEAELIHSYLHKRGVIAYVADTEAHVCNKSEQLEEMLRHLTELRDNCSTCRHKLLGYAPYAFPSYHRNLNYSVLNRYCDFNGPQLYWGTMRLPVSKAVRKMKTEWSVWKRNEQRQTGRAMIPLCPIGQTYGQLRRGEISRFFRLTKDYPSISFWDNQHAKGWMMREIRKAKHVYRPR